ncbi:MAG TPA: acyltransferase [Rhodanobacteraceae bacterium]|nr:acyltransferase [Rhodanobacteraceae bacterium]
MLRFVAASLVIYGHGSAITGGKGWPELFSHLGWGHYSGDIAVDIFFVISGFMVTGSFLRRRHLLDFLWARALRIYPALIFCLLVSAFVLGAICTSLPLARYFEDPATLHYVVQNFKLQTTMAWHLPGVFTHNPIRTTVNGSLWTLPAEIRMYLWVGLLGALGILARKWLASVVLLALFVCGVVQPDHLLWMPLASFVRLGGYFALGAFCYLHRQHIRAGWPMVSALVLIAYSARHTPAYPYAFGLALGAFVFAFAYCLPWHGFNRFGDYSYGMYLWGFPVQQAIAHYHPALTPIENAIPAFLLALVLAVLSWHFVEKPVLRWKPLPAKAAVKLGLVRRKPDPHAEHPAPVAQ